MGRGESAAAGEALVAGVRPLGAQLLVGLHGNGERITKYLVSLPPRLAWSGTTWSSRSRAPEYLERPEHA